MKLKISQKITGLLVFYFLVALVAIGSTLFVSWHLEGSAAAINDAGKERMRSYRIAFLLAQQVRQPALDLRPDIEQETLRFERTLIELKNGNPQRPLFLPAAPEVARQMAELQAGWKTVIKPRIQAIQQTDSAAEQARLLSEYEVALEGFVNSINDLVVLVEQSNAHATAMLRSFQIGLVVVALLGTILLDYPFLAAAGASGAQAQRGPAEHGQGRFQRALADFRQ